MNNITLAKKYSALLDEVYKKAAVTSILESDPSLAREGANANEIVIPIMLMTYMAQGSLVEYESLASLKEILVSNGWTAMTAVCTLIFILCHFPCSTSMLTIKKETGSLKWTALAFALPTVTGLALCFIAASGFRLAEFLGA